MIDDADEYPDELAEWEQQRSVGARLARQQGASNTPLDDPDAWVIRPLSSRVSGKGVDVANSENGDRAATCDFASNAVIRLEAFACPDANALGRKTKLEMTAAALADERVGVDATGVGAGTVNELSRLGSAVQGLHFGGKPIPRVELLPDGRPFEWTGDVNVFANLRSQLYWQLREDFRNNVIDVDGNPDCELWEELVSPTFRDEPKTIIEPKDEIRARLGRSPDQSDALAIANFVRERAVQPVVPDVPVGRSMGWDPTTQKARKRETGQEYIDRISGEGYDDTRTDRYAVPYRERGSPR